MTRGFTTIELFIVVGIMVIIIAGALPMYSNLQVTSQLNETNSQIAQTLRIARQQSVARLNNINHGVKFTANSYTLYQGSSYALRDITYDRTISLDSALTIATTLTSDEVNFSLATGIPDNTGTTTLTHSAGGTRQVNVNSFGVVTEN
ncbi:MAG: hypothetical protein PHT51_03220 [Patescibacteria group bacterium]|nr:hypothetical protein [Patescibacteria group bacterium]MDD4611114.1 hypothetical protein [Patescibacteria group bacterium]